MQADNTRPKFQNRPHAHSPRKYTSDFPYSTIMNRRTFLQTSTAAALATSLTPARAQIAGQKLRLGLIGCGGRGTGAAARHAAGLNKATSSSQS